MYIILLSLLIIIVIITSWTYKLYQQTVIFLAKKTCLLSKSQLQLLPKLNHITTLQIRFFNDFTSTDVSDLNFLSLLTTLVYKYRWDIPF